MLSSRLRSLGRVSASRSARFRLVALPALRSPSSPRTLFLQARQASSTRISVSTHWHSSPSMLFPSYVRIGKVTGEISKAARPEFVPGSSHDDFLEAILWSQWSLEHLQWMLQKDSIGQDFALLGSPGFLRRRLVMKFCEHLGREIEFVSLSRDTSEADLKQRREIENKTARFVDQSAVRAATEGRVLILEGLEKAERNILPIINNLLENREMALEDGRFLISHDRFDRLLTEGYTVADLERLKLVRVHPNFRVIALSLPAPKYLGNPLDPPLRSRFQARFVSEIPFHDLNDLLNSLASVNVVQFDIERIKRIAIMSQSLQAIEKVSKGSYSELRAEVPEFPQRGFLSLIKLLRTFPGLSLDTILSLTYPWKYINLKKAASASPAKIITDAFERFGVTKKEGVTVTDFRLNPNGTLIELLSGSKVVYSIPRKKPGLPGDPEKFVWTPQLRATLGSMLLSHFSGSDFALLGHKGSGKSSLIRQLASLLGFEIETQLLFKDLNQRDLLQRRVTLPNGDTIWENSNLVDAALTGRLALLDNIDRLHKDTLASIQSLIIDREAFLPDGKRLVHWETYDALLQSNTPQSLSEKGILRIHPDFRIIAVGDLPHSKNDYFTLELANCFNVHEIPEMGFEETVSFIQKIAPSVPFPLVSKITTFAFNLKSESEFRTMPFSLRQIIRSLLLASDNLKSSPNSGNIYHILNEALLSKFLPASTKAILNSILKRAGIEMETGSDLISIPSPGTSTLDSPSNPSHLIPKIPFFDHNRQKETSSDLLPPPKPGTLTSAPSSTPAHLVPKILFFENTRQSQILHEMSLAFNRGEPLLLIGNQGTGKNKLADYFLQTNRLPRQYVQLHRDTTVASLTSQPSIKDGAIVWEDSALVKAAREGHVLVIDEADKAEVEVVTILKNLMDGEMTLADHRRILSPDRVRFVDPSKRSSVIPIHPNFRLIVLANRPGWPFLGNNFFRECGDLFSTHAIDNPDIDSEVQLLKQYAPEMDETLLRKISACFDELRRLHDEMDETLLRKISACFDELRRLHDEGLLTYPYSTREVVNLVRHMAKFPNDPLPEVLENVFAFDIFNQQAKHHIIEAFKAQGVNLSSLFENSPRPAKGERLRVELLRDKVGPTTKTKVGKIDPENKPHVGGNTWAGGTGGRDTAGLGGRGGPFRMDSRNPIHQISDADKANVDKEVLRQAREMANSGLKDRLKEIHMTEYDASAYETYYNQVRLQIQQMRVILEGLEAQNNDARFWFKNQTTGDLDENKLVEGVTGEKTIFKRRIPPEKHTPNFHPQNKPKRIRFVMDISASMYRFDGADKRLRKLLETTVMVMESLEGFESKILYSIVGHSGDSDEIRLINEGNAPKNRRERLQVLQSMVAHSQYCWPGDQTIDATKKAIETIAKEEADAHFVFVLSDANFERYGIDPRKFGAILTSNEQVKAFGIFIASLWDGQADKIVQGMPAGRGFVCLNTADLPALFHKLLTSHVLND